MAALPAPPCPLVLDAAEPTILSDPPASVPSTTTLVEATRATAEPRSPLKEPTHTDTTGPPVPVREWESSVVYKGYVFNMKRVCVRRNRVLFLRKTWPYPEVSEVCCRWNLSAWHSQEPEPTKRQICVWG